MPAVEIAVKHIFSKQEAGRYMAMRVMEKAATYGLKYGDVSILSTVCLNLQDTLWFLTIFG